MLETLRLNEDHKQRVANVNRDQHENAVQYEPHLKVRGYSQSAPIRRHRAVKSDSCHDERRDYRGYPSRAPLANPQESERSQPVVRCPYKNGIEGRPHGVKKIRGETDRGDGKEDRKRQFESR